MWTFTRDGFFAVVKDSYCGEDELMIRGRNRGDIERLLAKAGDADSEIIELPDADYRFRTKIPVEKWAWYVSHEAAGIDYATVKDTLIGSDDDRSEAYFTCWMALQRYQQASTGEGQG